MKTTGWAVLLLTAVLGFASAQTVDKVLFREDLETIVRTVSEVHPAFVEPGRGEVLSRRAEALLAPLPDEVPHWRLGVTVAELLRGVNDGHTSTDLTFGSVRYLPLQFAWLSDGLIVAPVTGADIDIPAASEVLKLGELNPVTLESRLSQLVSENKYWVREIGSRHLAAEGVLRWLGVVEDDAVLLTFRTSSGETRTAEVALRGYRGDSSQEMQELLLKARGLYREWIEDRETFAWSVNLVSGYGLFWIRNCDNTPEYRRGVMEFFEEVTRNDVERVVISVQQNGGGDSEVIDILLLHLPVADYAWYASNIRVSRTVLRDWGAPTSVLDATPEQLERLIIREGQPLVRQTGNLFHWPSEKIQNRQAGTSFDGDVYLLTDPGSFSSGMWMATVLSDNNFATPVGEPTGGTPTNYGFPFEFRTPNLSLLFYVSHRYWIRPDPSRDPADTLMPDIPLPITVEDVQTGHSPILAWLETLAAPKP